MSKCYRPNCNNNIISGKTCELCKKKDKNKRNRNKLCIAKTKDNKSCPYPIKYNNYCAFHKLLDLEFKEPTEIMCSRANHGPFHIDQFKVVNGVRQEMCIKCWDQIYIQKVEVIPTLEEQIIVKIQSYKEQAERRNRNWGISDEFAKLLFLGNCFYCGKKPTPLNGIDRIDNDISYIETNVCSCCTLCNRIKNTLEMNCFIGICVHIHNYQLNKECLYPQLFPNNKLTYFNRFKKQAISRNIIFELTEQNFNDIISNKCFYCGKENTINHKNGIDRIDSQIGYIINNCYSCCKTCNFIKNRININKLFKKFKKISEIGHTVIIPDKIVIRFANNTFLNFT